MAGQAETKDATSLVCRGRTCRIEFGIIDDTGASPARAFFEGLPDATQTRLFKIFQHVAENGHLGLPDGMFCHERDEISTFKCKLEKRRIRMPCFRRENRWIITGGFFKPSQAKWDEQAFTEANRVREIVNARDAAQQKRQQATEHKGERHGNQPPR